MSATVLAGVEVPGSPLARDLTALLRDSATDLIYHHSRRVFFWGSLRGRRRGLTYDPELLYAGAVCHDLGLTGRFAESRQRFELDGADEARRVLLDHGVPPERADLVWQGIALHTTPEIPWRMAPEVALVTAGVELDVLGLGYDEITEDERAEVTAAHPRPDFKREILKAFTEGMAHRPDSTFGTVNADVLAHCLPGFTRGDFVETILNSKWPA
ncbi:HD domain-containing protein [Actinoallomurus iriomotensis]|uniref:Phosphohydrolase n=1 Tax=Actinoallomurus iriomotensis TaxID=478107 RepID=A0A9W6RDY7_9ACTN|nr:HD domain-containing protein [Actinoallomurus iriomotensis]GLY74038.1 phosphohydrolase [Actinoallomurus iriomotensis]